MHWFYKCIGRQGKKNQDWKFRKDEQSPVRWSYFSMKVMTDKGDKVPRSPGTRQAEIYTSNSVAFALRKEKYMASMF